MPFSKINSNSTLSSNSSCKTCSIPLIISYCLMSLRSTLSYNSNNSKLSSNFISKYSKLMSQTCSLLSLLLLHVLNSHKKVSWVISSRTTVKLSLLLINSLSAFSVTCC